MNNRENIEDHSISRREFIKYASASALSAGVTAGLSTTAKAESQEDPEPRKYGIFFGAVTPVFITPHHPEFAEEYESYLETLRKMQMKAPNLFGLVQDVVSYTYGSYGTERIAGSKYPSDTGDGEVMEFIRKGKGDCGSLSLLCQYGLHELGIHTLLYVMEFIATEGPEYETILHANLEAKMAKPNERSKYYVLESTNGMIMERGEYYRNLDDAYKISYGIVTKHPVKTGLE